MKPETKMARILASEASPKLKIMQLQTLALRCFASSPMQKEVVATYKRLMAEHGLDYPAIHADLA